MAIGLGSNNRATTIRRVVRGAANTGGTSAPRAAAQGPHIGLGQAQRPYKPKIGLGQNQPAGPKGGPLAPLNSQPQGDPNALPLDPAYDSKVNALNTAFDNTNLSLNQQDFATRQAYGLDPQFADPTQNPYTKAALLQASYLKANHGSTNSYASQGQLYAGSLSNALDTNRSSYGAGYDELNRAYLGDLGNIQGQRTAAANTRDLGISDAFGDRVDRAIAQAPDPTTAPAPPAAVKKKAKKAAAKVANRRRA